MNAETYTTYTQNWNRDGFTIWYQGTDYQQACNMASQKKGFVVRESDKAVDGEDGWTGSFDPFFQIPVHQEATQ